jgi:hypothetical protein
MWVSPLQCPEDEGCRVESPRSAAAATGVPPVALAQQRTEERRSNLHCEKKNQNGHLDFAVWVVRISLVVRYPVGTRLFQHPRSLVFPLLGFLRAYYRFVLFA